MKIKLDENMPASLVDALAKMGHDVDTVVVEGLAGKDDRTVWNATQEAHRFLITQDLDFSDMRAFAPGAHRGILLVRLREPGRTALLQRIEAMFAENDVESWAECFVVGTEHKIRIRRP